MFDRLFDQESDLASATLRESIGELGVVDFFIRLREQRLLEEPIDADVPKNFSVDEDLNSLIHEFHLTLRDEANASEQQVADQMASGRTTGRELSLPSTDGGGEYTPALFLIDLEKQSVSKPLRRPGLFTGCGSAPSNSWVFEVSIEGRVQRDRPCVFCLFDDQLLGELKYLVTALVDENREIDFRSFVLSPSSLVIETSMIESINRGVEVI